MHGLLKYLATVPQQLSGIDGNGWVKVNRIIQDTGMTREEIYLMATRAKPKGLINWTFFGLFSIE